jgi:hypothetical protein
MNVILKERLIIKEKLQKKESLTYIEIHQLTKVFKDQNNNHKQVVEILSLFNSKYDDVDSPRRPFFI